MNKQQGYVFIDDSGEYAMVTPHCGHGSASHVVRFTRDINEATIFTNKNAYYGTLLSHDSRDRLVKHCQPLKAKAVRVVRLENWSEQDGTENKDLSQ